jgi:hypothetical protein
MSLLRAQVAIVGGGISGLWTLARLRQAGVDAVLLEAYALGHGQTAQAQGIVHGGGKYALRSVGDRQAIEAIREMPERWREHHSGTRRPSLANAAKLSDFCWLWLPRGHWRARIEAMGLLPMLRHGGILHCPPVAVDRGDWPAGLRDSALRVYRMAEPIFSTVSVQACLAEPLQEHCYRILPDAVGDPVARGDDGSWQALRVAGPESYGALEVRADAFVLCAGEGNARWIEAGGGRAELMQRRPLLMFLARGNLPPLHGHCFLGGRTRMTITSHDLDDGRRVWQLGGEVAERNADCEDRDQAIDDCRRELHTVLPGLDPRGLEIATYRAVRAERSRPDHRRPGGVQVERVGANAWAAWPTKWALAPLLADELLEEVSTSLRAPRSARPVRWVRPAIAPAPWEEVSSWSADASVAAD